MSLRYLLSALEPLDFTCKPKMSTRKVLEMFQLNLSSRVMNSFHDLQLIIDIQNVMQGLCDQKIDSRSLNSLSSFEKKIKEGRVAEFVDSFYKKYPTKYERIVNFSVLFRDSLDYVYNKGSGFLSHYCKQEKELLAFLTTYRAIRSKKSVESELFFEDKGDLFIAFLLGQKNSVSPPYEFKQLFVELQEANENPLKEYKAVAKYRFDCYYDYVKDYGSIENSLLAYFVCLALLEDMIALDKQEGLSVVKRLVESEYASQ